MKPVENDKRKQYLLILCHCDINPYIYYYIAIVILCSFVDYNITVQ